MQHQTLLDSIKPYDETDYYDVVKWFQDRKMVAPSRYDLPSIGFIVPAVAAGFLITTNCNIAIVEYFISNKDVLAPRRKNALNIITKALVNKAVKMGYTRIKCDSQIDTIKKRAQDFGAKYIGDYSVFMKEFDNG